MVVPWVEESDNNGDIRSLQLGAKATTRLLFWSGRVESAREWLHDMNDTKVEEMSMRLQIYNGWNSKYL